MSLTGYLGSVGFVIPSTKNENIQAPQIMKNHSGLYQNESGRKTANIIIATTESLQTLNLLITPPFCLDHTTKLGIVKNLTKRIFLSDF